MNVKEIGRKGVDWFHLAKYRENMEGCCERSNDPSGFINCVEFLERVRNCWILKMGFCSLELFSSSSSFSFPCF